MSLSKFFDDIAGGAEELFGRIKDKKIFSILVSACFLIARADGTFDSDEKTALAQLVKKHMPHFKIKDILAQLVDCENKIAFDETLGIQEIMDEISKAQGDDARLVMRACCYIGASDGEFDEDEKNVARTIARAMGMDPSRYDL